MDRSWPRSAATDRRSWILGCVSRDPRIQHRCRSAALTMLGLLTLIAVSAGGCSRFGKSLRSPAPAPMPAPQPSGIPVGTVAPEIVGEDLDGESFKLSDYRGQ